MTAADHALAGHTVLVTRPAHQSRPLCEQIEQAGARALSIPALEIVPRDDTAAARAELDVLGDADIAVFVSANAVEQALGILGPDGIPGAPALAAVGRATAEALEAAGYPDVIRPERRFDSEGLLDTPAFAAVRDRHVVIVRGRGGREWLGETLRAAGARVSAVEIYGRGIPQASPAALQTALAGHRASLAVISSNAGVDNLLAMAGERLEPALCALPAVVLSERTRAHAASRGFAAPIEVAARAEDGAVVEALAALATRIEGR